MKDEKNDINEKGAKGTTTRKINNLKKQYDKILTDLFEQYAGECIEEALNSSESAFGADITTIVGTATDLLRGKVLADLGVELPDGECAMLATTIGAGSPMDISDTLGINIDADIEDIDDGDEDDEEED